jgi:hypothetical protein
MKRWLLFAVELLIAVNALYGGVGLIVDGMGMPANWLAQTPFTSWTLPGVLLLVVVGVPMALAAGAELVRSPAAYRLSLTAGVLLVWRIGAQILVLRRFFFLQPVLGVAGLVVLALAWWAHGRVVSRPAGQPAIHGRP